MQNIYFFVGTTAEFIKLFPVIKELKKRKLRYKIITSGQNKILFEEIASVTGKIKSDISFGEKDKKSSVFHFGLWAAKTLLVCIFTLRSEFKGKNKKKTYFIVHGDTVSSLIGAFVARIYGVKLVHVESGLRSFNFFEPFPEELCRWIVSSLSDVHFCPNVWSASNLRRKKGSKINTFQNTLIESFWAALKNAEKADLPIKSKQKYFVLVIHRQEHVIFKKQQTKILLEYILQDVPKDLICVFIMHELTASFMHTINANVDNKANIILLPRLSYISFVKLIQDAEFLMTDGGSNQEEAYYLGKPCLILRNVTERIEGLDHNAVLSKRQRETIKNFIDNFPKYKQRPIISYQKPSEIIVDYLLNKKGINAK